MEKAKLSRIHGVFEKHENLWRTQRVRELMHTKCAIHHLKLKIKFDTKRRNILANQKE